MSTVHVDSAAAELMLTDLIDRVDAPDVLLRFLGEEIADYEAEVFATQGHGSWAALDPDTVKSKGSGRVLVDTGDLLDSLTRPGASGTRIAGDSVTISTSEVSGLFAQRGARGMPQRNPAPAPPPRVVQQWGEHLLQALVDGSLT